MSALNEVIQYSNELISVENGRFLFKNLYQKIAAKDA